MEAPSFILPAATWGKTAYDRIFMYRLDRARTATKVRTKTETESETRRGDSNRNKDRNDKYRGQKQG